MKRTLERAAWLVGTVLVLLAGASSYMAWRIAGVIVVAPDHGQPRARRDPKGEYGLDFEPVQFRATDGIVLRGWVVPTQEPRAAAVLAHGRSGTRQSLLDLVPGLHAAGYCTLVYDTRGHGESDDPGPGDAFRGGDRDVVAAVDLLRRRCRVERVAVIGSSQGAASAIRAAAASRSVDAVVAIGAGPSLYDVVRASPRLARLPDWLVAYATRLALWRIGAPADRILDIGAGPITLVDRIAPRPLFLIHGTEDDTVPLMQAGRLYARAGSPKKFWVVPGGPHAGLRGFVGPAFSRRVVRFLDTYMLGAGGRE